MEPEPHQVCRETQDLSSPPVPPEHWVSSSGLPSSLLFILEVASLESFPAPSVLVSYPHILRSWFNHSMSKTPVFNNSLQKCFTSCALTWRVDLICKPPTSLFLGGWVDNCHCIEKYLYEYVSSEFRASHSLPYACLQKMWHELKRYFKE